MKRKITQIAYLTVLGAMMLLGISACKKSDVSGISDIERIEQAKQWYEQDQKGLATMVQSAKGQVAALSFNPQWENAQVTQSDGKAVVVAPVSSNLQNIMGKQTTYHLVISNENGSYTSKIVSVKNLANENTQLDAGELYQAAFNSKELNADMPIYANISVYDRGFKLAGQTLYKGKMRETVDQKASMTLKEAIDMQKQQLTEIKFCTEWFLITYEYDDYGNVYNVHETSLGKSCETYYQETIDWIDNGPPTSASPEYAAALSATDLQPANDAVGSSSTITETAQEREMAYEWTVMKTLFPNWSIRSHEVGTHEKPGYNWQWKSLVHAGYSTPGKPTWVTCNINHISAIATLGTYSASIEVRFGLEAYVGIRGVNVGRPSSSEQATSPTWNIPYN